jgi:hypothetical protein
MAESIYAKIAYAVREREDEEQAFLSDPDYIARCVEEAYANAGVEKPAEPAPEPYKGGILTHNGVFTVKSVKTGDHRTFRIRTQPQDSSFAPGKRVLSILRGPDNTNDYKGFAFVDEHGIHIWSKSYNALNVKYAAMLEKLAEHSANGLVEVFASTRCRVCNRTLTTPESVASGIGPVCEGRI